MPKFERFSAVTNKSYLLENFFQYSRDFLCVAGYDGYFKNVNPAFIELLGYTEREMLSKPISEFIYKEDRTVTLENRNSLKRNIPLLNFENRYVSKEGAIIWLSWTSIPEPENEIVYAIAKDVTYIKSKELERNELLTNLTKANSDLKQLSYTSSHDLRSPVNNMLSLLELLDLSKIDDEESLKYLELIKHSAVTLKATIDQQVDQFAIQDSLIVKVEELNVEKILNDTLASIRSLITKSGVKIHVNFSEFTHLKFNASYLHSIFLNLISNSIKYAQPGITPRVSIAAVKSEDCKQLIFSDNGLGFNLDMVKDRIFGLHQKFHNHIDSKGIGLYLVYNHITSLGGKITVESEVNEGTTFVLSFPR